MKYILKWCEVCAVRGVYVSKRFLLVKSNVGCVLFKYFANVLKLVFCSNKRILICSQLHIFPLQCLYFNMLAVLSASWPT